MGRGLNVWVGIGNLTRDPTLKYLPSGMAVCNFSIALNESKKVGDKWEPTVQYFEITAWGKRGETVAQYLTKGSQVCVRGRIQQGEYMSQKKGHVVKTTTVNADEVVFIGGRPGGTTRREPDGEHVDRPAGEDIPSRDVNADVEPDPESGNRRIPDYLKEPATEVEEPLPQIEDDAPIASAGDGNE